MNLPEQRTSGRADAPLTFPLVHTHLGGPATVTTTIPGGLRDAAIDCDRCGPIGSTTPATANAIAAHHAYAAHREPHQLHPRYTAALLTTITSVPVTTDEDLRLVAPCHWEGCDIVHTGTDPKALAAAITVHDRTCWKAPRPPDTSDLAEVLAALDQRYRILDDDGEVIDGHAARARAAELDEALLDKANDLHAATEERDTALAEAARLQALLDDQRHQAATTDLAERITTVRTELARADNKSMTVLSGGSWLLGAGIAVAGLAGIDLPLAATVAGWTAAGAGVTSLALLLGTISPRLRGGTALMHYAETSPAELGAAAEARAADLDLAREEAAAELHEMAGLALAKYRRLRVAVRCTYLAGLSGVVAVVATGITAIGA